MKLSEIDIVLVRPSLEANVGSVCRLIANFGLGELRIVEGEPFADALVTAVAHGAERVWEEHREFDELAGAVADAHWTVGTTRRSGRFREPRFDPASVAQAIARRADGERVALVFGSEFCGLTTDELSLSSAIVEIPQQPVHPSLNLSHAVAIVGYECYRALAGAESARTSDGPAAADRPRGIDRPSDPLATQAERHHLSSRMAALIEGSGWPESAQHRLVQSLSRFLMRIPVEEPEIRMLHAWLEQCVAALKNRD